METYNFIKEIKKKNQSDRKGFILFLYHENKSCNK